MTAAAARTATLRRRLVQPLWSALDAVVGSHAASGVLLAVSGGPDSRALLEACARWPRREDGAIVVAAVDHGRRADARREAELVVARALALGFDAEVLRARVDGAGEAALRLGRLRALAEAARARGLGSVATAHHADDDAEGFLLDALGQGGGKGGAAMASSTSLHGVRVLRPFLLLTRAQLALACTAVAALDFVVDAEDARGVSRRAALRRRAVPALAAQPRLALKARRAAEDEAALGVAAAAAVRKDGDDVVVDAGLPRAVLRRAVMLACAQAGAAPDPRSSARTLDHLLDAASSARTAMFDLAGVKASLERGLVRVRAVPRMPSS